MIATLGQVVQGEVEVRSPAVWVIGQVVRLRERLEAQRVTAALQPRQEVV
ncbi:hypothetical protein Mrose_02922 [Calidithermus roseus]|uniref:Uncharacterized protein n=1 Tax=Calidithermus roseus TaxID=1644118 RepID=A0A399ENN5_9DEIN|nr:hypothetical protein Mrose_02922 [Calidithermus roseus]